MIQSMPNLILTKYNFEQNALRISKKCSIMCEDLRYHFRDIIIVSNDKMITVIY